MYFCRVYDNFDGKFENAKKVATGFGVFCFAGVALAVKNTF
jgi:hypothetical protein